MTSKDYDYIDSDEKLAVICASLAQASYCAIDTEFIREKTYYPILALIQIASEDHQACIDPLAINDFSPLQELLANESLVKVFHSSSQDLEILFQKFESLPVPVFDTQVAAAVLGYNHQISYADLVQQVTGVRLEKKHTRADWSRRPLSEDELDYAMDDVRYLMPVYIRLQSELESSKRGSWIDRELRAMSDADNYRVDMSSLWKRLKGANKLKGVKLQVASELCQWRESVAQQRDKPRRWITKDDVLVDIARRMPQSLEELSEIRDLGERLIERHGSHFLEIVTHAQTVDAAQWPQPDKAKVLSVCQLALGDCLMALCRVIADDNKIALASLATRKDIDSLIINQKTSRLSQGWRFSMVGEQLLNFIHGQSSLHASEEGIVLE